MGAGAKRRKPICGEWRPSAREREQVFISFGIHQCTGQSLAGMELQCVFGSIFRKLPHFALAVPFEELEFKHEQLFHGLRMLPITWSG